jgi:predicted MFS family arabinose efflux permease
VLVGCVAGSYSARAPEAASSTVWQDIGEGLRWLWQHELLRTLCALLAIMNATIAAGEAVLVLYALEVLGVGTVGYSLLLVAFAVGGVGGTLVGPAVGRMLGLRGAVALAGLGQAAALAVTGTTSNVVAATVVMVAIGVASMTWNVITVSLRHKVVPAELLGRVTSSYRVVGLSAMPVGAAVGGALAKAYGLHAPFAIGGAVLAAATVICVPFIRVHRT